VDNGNGPAYPPGVVVVGMHRSGTSLVTSIFGACGYRLAEQMLKPRRANPRGYFEDRAIHDLHKKMLSLHGLQWNDVEGLRKVNGRSLPIPADCAGEAGQLVHAYREGGPWAWKNPRATLFLSAWAELLPEAHFVVCLRHPAAVVDSMLRRGDKFGVPRSERMVRLRRLARGLSLWHSYNLAAWNFAQAQPRRVSVVRIPRDLSTLQRATNGAVFEAELLHAARGRVRLPASVAVQSHVLYRRLAALARPDDVTGLLTAVGG